MVKAIAALQKPSELKEKNFHKNYINNFKNVPIC